MTKYIHNAQYAMQDAHLSTKKVRSRRELRWKVLCKSSDL